jgi:transposase
MDKTQSNTRRPRKDYCYRHRGKYVPPHLPALNLNAAGIDVGAELHYVSVPEDRDPEPIRSFGCYTSDLERMAQWLLACGVDTVVLESTGVYWIPVFRVLEEHGLKVQLVDARHVKYVPGRKTDVADCQWLRQLHTFGLLSGAFVPPQPVQAMRAYWRQRKEVVESAAEAIQHMQKALTQMNLRLAVVLSDISGVSGMKILRAMVGGERDPLTLARLVHPSVQSSEEEIVQALTGHYSEEQLFILKQSLDRYDFCQLQMQECDRQLEAHLEHFPSKKPAPPEPQAAAPAHAGAPALPEAPAPAPGTRAAFLDAVRSPHKRRKNEPYFDLKAELMRILGVDLTAIPGIDAMTAFTICAEIGFDVSAFPSVKQFCSWLGLCPNNQVTGGKVKRRRTKKVKNRAADAFRISAQSLHRSQSYLGAYYRYLRGRLGAPKAITAIAHRQARLVYSMLKYGQAYVDRGQEHLERQHRERRYRSLVRNARELGYELLDPVTGEILASVG